jgi:hypothetical protein
MNGYPSGNVSARDPADYLIRNVIVYTEVDTR